MADEKPCEICNGTGIAVIPLAYHDGNSTLHAGDIGVTCHGCNGTGNPKDGPQIQGEPMKHAPSAMAQTQRQMPRRIYISNEKGTPIDTTIYDAETGEQVPGVVEVNITRKHIEAVVIPHWPLTPADHTANNPPDYDGETRDGVNVERHSYPLKRLEAESW